MTSTLAAPRVMLNFVSRAPDSIVKVTGVDVYCQYCGLLTGTFSAFRPETALQYSAWWAADNGCFLPGYNPDAIVSMLRRYRGLSGCKFVVVPDAPRDAQTTMQLFSAWIGTYRNYGYPAALVIQNGIEHYSIPWDSLECIFIGGDDHFKYSDIVKHIVTEARLRGKWVHNGRVNTPQRILYSRAIGCDSIDGTHFTHVPADVVKYLPYQTTEAHIARLAYPVYANTKKSKHHQSQLPLWKQSS